MCYCIEICNGELIAYPHTFLAGIFKARIISFTFRTQGIAGFKIFTAAVKGKAQVIWDGNPICAAPVLFTIVKLHMVNRTLA